MDGMKRNALALKSCAVLAFAALFALVALEGAIAKDVDARFGKPAFAASVAAALGHELSGAERGASNVTWDFYNVKWKKDWTEERYALAVAKGVENCGKLGKDDDKKKDKEKNKSLSETAKAESEKVSDWVKNHTDTSAKDKAEGGN